MLADSQPVPARAEVKSSALGRIDRHHWTAFAVFAAFHAALWTILPTVFYLNLPLDLIESLTYGREWQLGYDKLPPLPWWLVDIVYRIAGHGLAYLFLARGGG